MDPCDSCYTIKPDLHYFIKYTILMFICLLFHANMHLLFLPRTTAFFRGSAYVTTLLHKICFDFLA